jgi:hypothetical protein
MEHWTFAREFSTFKFIEYLGESITVCVKSNLQKKNWWRIKLNTRTDKNTKNHAKYWINLFISYKMNKLTF